MSIAPEMIADLQAVGLFKGLEAEVPKFVHLCDVCHFQPGDVISKQGLASSGLYIIASGKIRMTVQILGDQEIAIGSLAHHSHFGEIAILGGHNSVATATATTESTLYFLSQANIFKLNIHYPNTMFKLRMNVAKATCKRIRYINELVKRNFLYHEIKHSTVKKATHENGQVRTNIVINDDIKDTMMRLKFFRNLELDELVAFIANVECFSAPRSMILFQEEQTSQSIFMPILGAVQAIEYFEGRFSKLELYGPGELFGTVPYIDDKKHLVSALLREDSLILEFTPESLDHLHHHNIAVWYKVHDLIFLNLAKVLNYIEKLLVRSKILGKSNV